MTASPASNKDRIIDVKLPRMSAFDLVGWKVMGLRNRIDDLLWERRLKIRTRGQFHIHVADAHFYDTFAFCSIMRVLDRFTWSPNDVFVDIGCGKGRVVCCAALRTIGRVLGVDLDETLCEHARRNAESMQHRQSPIEIIHAPAQEVDYSACTKFFLFNPFGASTLRQVLSSIEKTLHGRPRTIEIAYVNPVHDDVMPELPGLTRFDQWHWRAWSRLKHDVSFWRCEPGRT